MRTLSRVTCALAALAAALGSASAAGEPRSPSKALDAVGSSGQRYAQWSQQQPVVEGEDKTLSPYFYVAGGDPETERLPLKETSAEVNIAGVIARVKVRQVFENSGGKPIEAVYVFPASTRAAVHGMRMKIGSRTVEAKIEKKQTAREQYEQARREGKRASLLEQQRPNVFTMNVANLMPRDRIEVELDYSELLIPEEAVYEFVYPTVVGPRYGGGADPQKDKWISNPYLKEGEKEPYRFDIRVHVESGIALKELASPSHKVTVNYLSKSSADVRLQESGGGNKDFVLRYRLAGDQVETGVLAWKDEKEGFFTVLMEPPQRPAREQIVAREYIFLLDVSGSMHGFPLETAKAVMRDLLKQLRSTDQFNIALFSGANYVWHAEGSVPATSANLEAAIALIGRQTGGGGTELMGGLQGAYAIPKRDRTSRTVVVVTDGYVGVEAQAFKFIRERLDQANLFAFGIGSSVNRGLIEGMARAGQGEPFVVLKPERAAEQASKFRAYIDSPVLTNIQVRFAGMDAYEVAPMKVPDLMARRPVVLFGKFRGEPRGRVEVSGISGGGRWAQSLEMNAVSLKAENSPLKWLWARKWVAMLDDELHLGAAKEIEEAITDLGLSYNLLTSFTSFVAVDSQVANKSGQAETVNQPLPLPEGVSNMAVGGLGTKGGGGYGALAPASPPALRKSMSSKTDNDFGAAFGRGAAAAQPSPAPVAATSTPEKFEARSEAKKPADKQVRIVRVALESKANVRDAESLRQAVELAVRMLGGCSLRGNEKLVVRVDKQGRIVKLEIQGADASAAACLKQIERSLKSSAVADGAEQGTVTLRLTLQ